MFQIIFNELSAAEMSALPKTLQLDLLAEFQILPEDLDRLDNSRFGLLERDGKRLYRYRAKDYRIYFEKTLEGITVHRVLNKNTMRDAIEDASTNEKQFDKALDFIADTRRLAADFLGTEIEEISLTGPTSVGLNAVANGLDWKGGDEVVCYLDDYPADVYPWLNLERRGVKPVLLQTARLGEITPEIVENALTERTRLVALASAHNISGYRIDVEAIGTLCAKRDVLFSLDA